MSLYTLKKSSLKDKLKAKEQDLKAEEQALVTEQQAVKKAVPRASKEKRKIKR